MPKTTTIQQALELDTPTLEQGGYAMPAHYGNAEAEYQAARQGAALFDRSHTGKLLLTGNDAPDFLHNISTNDIKPIPLGGGAETYFCDSKAKALFVAIVYHIRHEDDHALWLSTTPGYNEGLYKHLDRFLIAEAVTITDVTDAYSQFHLTGPDAKKILNQLLDGALPELGEFQHVDVQLAEGCVVSVRRCDELGLEGYNLVCQNSQAGTLWQTVVSAGATPAGMSAYEVLRIEAGTPYQGVDFDDTRFVLEVGTSKRAISYTKGCFPGQEPIVMARDRSGRVNRAFRHFAPTAGTSINVGDKLLADGKEVGIVTSSTDSPQRGGPLGLGYVKWTHQEPGTTLQLADQGEVEVLA